MSGAKYELLDYFFRNLIIRIVDRINFLSETNGLNTHVEINIYWLLDGNQYGDDKIKTTHNKPVE